MAFKGQKAKLLYLLLMRFDRNHANKYLFSCCCCCCCFLEFSWFFFLYPHVDIIWLTSSNALVSPSFTFGLHGSQHTSSGIIQTWFWILGLLLILELSWAMYLFTVTSISSSIFLLSLSPFFLWPLQQFFSVCFCFFKKWAKQQKLRFSA